MLRGITVIVGPARCGKTDRLVNAYRQVLGSGSIGAALWLSPTHRSAAAIGGQTLAGSLSGCFSPNCLTFDQFARRVLDASAQKTRPIGLPLQRQLLRRLVDEASRRGPLRYFEPIARRPGFLDLLVSFIQELKRLEIWPQELSEACGRRTADKDRELFHLYDQYQRLLTKHNLYDAQGRFWSARALLREGLAGPLAHLRHVFVDGFTDFTRTEHEMLEILAGRVDSLSISLPGEVDSSRGDLFAKSAKTLAELRRRHPQMVVDEMPRRRMSPTAIAHVERHLFAQGAGITPVRDAEGIEIVAAGGATHEIELLARRIKRLLAEGDPDAAGAPVRPADVLVVFRSLDETADQLREIFGQFGVPVAIGIRPALRRAPITAALTAWLRLDLDDWPFRQVLATLAHNYFRPQWPEWQAGRAAAAAEPLVRRLQIPAGRAELIGNVERWARQVSAAKTAPTGTRSSLAEQAKSAAPLLARMGRSLDDLPKRATLADWTKAITRLAETVGMLDAADLTPAASSGRSLDRAAWQQLIAALAASERLSTSIDSRPLEFSRREFFDHLQEILRCELLSGDHDETGRVRVLSAENARNLSVPYVFVAGLAEQAFPPHHREDCIYSEAETAQLIAAGLPLVPHADRSRYEMLLFYEVVTRATRRLVLSYPALDARAQPLSPSPYVSEIERVCAPHRIRKTAGPELSSVPDSDDVLSPRDFRVRAVSQALAGDAALLAELNGHPSTLSSAGNILAGLRASWSRQRGESFGPFEGMLLSEAASRALRARYGPDRCWSPSQLEQYARCPYQFFLDRVLRLTPLDEPVLEINYLGRGQMLHWLCFRPLHRDLNARLGRAVRLPSAANRNSWRKRASCSAGCWNECRAIGRWKAVYWKSTPGMSRPFWPTTGGSMPNMTLAGNSGKRRCARRISRSPSDPAATPSMTIRSTARSTTKTRSRLTSRSN